MPFLIHKTTQFITVRAQCRYLHLVHEIFTKFPNGKLAACVKQKLNIQPKPFTILKPSGKIAVNSVKEALEHIEPMTHLSKVCGDQIYQFSKLDAPRPSPNKPSGAIKETAGCRDGNAREFHLKTDASSCHLAHVLSKAYQVLSFRNVDLRRVEFHVTMEEDFSIEWALQNCPHLRPEMILAAMPPETMVLAPPLADGRRKLMWALYRTQTSAEARETVLRRAELQAKRLLRESADFAVEMNGSKVNDVKGEIVADKGESGLSSQTTDAEKLHIARRSSRKEREEAKPRNLLRNEQLWNEPCKRFQRAWKREAYQKSERFLVKQRMRRAREEDPIKAKAKGNIRRR